MPRSVHVPQRQNQTSCLLLEKPPQEVRAQPLTSQNGVASRCGRAAMAENRTMKEKPALCIQGMAREFVRESIIEDAATRLIVQIMTEVADAHIAPRDAEIASLRAQLDEVRTLWRVIASVYDDKPDDYVVSVGHWYDPHPELPPQFCADVRLTAGQIRALLSESKT